MSGNYGPGGYPGQGYGDPRYEDPGDNGDPRYNSPPRGREPGQPRGRQPDPGYNTPGYDQSRYDQSRYEQPRYDEPRYDDRDQDRSFLPGFTPHEDPRTGGRGNAPAPGRRGQDPGYQDPGYQEPGYRDPGYRAPDYQDPGYRGQGPGGQTPNGPNGPGQDPGPRRRDGDWDDDPFAFRKRRKKTRWIPRVMITAILLVIVVGGVGGGLYIYHKYQARYHPADFAGKGTGDVTFQVKSGDNAFTLAPRLLAAGVIASDRAFTSAAESSTASTNSNGLEAGYYVLHHHMQASLAWAALINSKNVVQTTVTIPEGKRTVDVIKIIAEHTKIPLKDLQQLIASPAKLGLPAEAKGKVEGYLFPATYAIVPHETALEVLQEMVQRYDVEAEHLSIAVAAKSVGLTPAQLIIEASLVQAEGGTVSDYAKVAEVINNRIKDGMPLQFDSAVLYGLGKYGTRATFAQTRTPGPYNIYMNKGLPVGPIDNPGDAAIQGILHPDHGDWLYFLTEKNGKNVFSATPLKGQ